MSDVSAVESSRSAQIGRAPHDNRHIASTTRCFPSPDRFYILYPATSMRNRATVLRSPRRQNGSWSNSPTDRCNAASLTDCNLNGGPEAAATTVLVPEQRDLNSVCLVVHS